MFTGIIQCLGTLTEISDRGADMRLAIEAPELDSSRAGVGDSIAVNGVCLTAVEITGQGFYADVSRETLNHTTLGMLRPQVQVNLETALTPTSALGGHLVSGHVDGLGQVLERRKDARSDYFRFQVPQALARYIPRKGSICIDGVSLTVNEVDAAQFSVNIVPHTLQHTCMSDYQIGQDVNLEVDQIARYLERLLLAQQSS
jgi:riboflavin synthase